MLTMKTREATFLFGPFTLRPEQRTLLCDGTPVSLGGRAFDLLVVLLKRAGEIVSQRELIEKVWPDLVVEEGNLRVHVAALRKALDDGTGDSRYIETVPRRGYAFVSAVTVESYPPQPQALAALASSNARSRALPPPLGRMVGRERDVKDLCALVETDRFASIVGAGGMGKTTVALATAHRLSQKFGDEVVFVDLTEIAKENLVEAALSSAIGLSSKTDDLLTEIIGAVADRRMLVILDNCEHLVDSVSAVTERLFAEAPNVFLLATSREALRAEGENVYPLRALESPAPDSIETASAALDWPAVQLFMGRATASGYRHRLTDQEAPIVAEICHRLDGMPLAIELAAGRVPSYGIAGTAQLLDHSLKLMWTGRRQVVRRHQTMKAVLDWSFNLLSETEKRTLMRLSIFVGSFSLSDACSVVANSAEEETDIALTLESLADKSLLIVGAEGGTIVYRLLDMARAYASNALLAAGDGNATARRHAHHVYAVLAGPDPVQRGNLIGNLRAAFERSIADPDETDFAVDLTARAVPVLLSLSLLRECGDWCTRALAILGETRRGSREELALWEGVAASRMFARGNGADVREALFNALDIAVAIDDRDREFHLLAGLHIFHSRVGDFREMLRVSERVATVAAALSADEALISADWMYGTALHLSGDQIAARRHFEEALQRSAASGQRHLSSFGYDQRGRGLIAMTRCLWLLGAFARSAAIAEEALTEARELGQPVALCIALIYTTTASLWGEDFETVEGPVEELIQRATSSALEPYRAVGIGLRGIARCGCGDRKAGIEDLRNALAELERETHRVLVTDFQRALAEALARDGRVADAEEALDRAVATAEANGEAFQRPELLRTRGIIALAASPLDAAKAETLLHDAIDEARAHGIFGFALKASIALAGLLVDVGRADEASQLLEEALAHIESASTQPIVAAAGDQLHLARRVAGRT
ncbi:ATP-binding protein [Acuticoccus sediminis]|uniref:ATP-binding protein n=1 Tax=Acuticoccus sediminis TaxID=2184697 RepID=UPI001CFC7CE6|nr:winged helix-turn-helix domain-containing protein [Acuticoccus sediminis]